MTLVLWRPDCHSARPTRYNGSAGVKRSLNKPVNPRRKHDHHLAAPTHRLDDTADRVDLADPFQRKWYIRQIIEHGKAEDVAELDLDKVARLLEELNLPPHLHSLWPRFLEPRHATR